MAKFAFRTAFPGEPEKTFVVTGYSRKEAMQKADTYIKAKSKLWSKKYPVEQFEREYEVD